MPFVLEDVLSLTRLSSMTHAQECGVNEILQYLCFCDFYKHGSVESQTRMDFGVRQTWGELLALHLVVVQLGAS